MKFRTIKWLLAGPAALIASVLLTGCAHENPAPAQPAAPQATAPAPQEENLPAKAAGELTVVTAKVDSIKKKDRIVVLKYPDGKKVHVKCGPEVRNFDQIRVGDDVTAEFLETAELFVVGPDNKPIGGQSAVVKRAPKGAKPAGIAVESVEIAATVEKIDYNSRMVTLKSPEGKIVKVKASPTIERLNEVKPGDTIVARYTQALAIKVTSPKAK